MPALASPVVKPRAVLLAVLTTLATPALAQGATLSADPAQRCYRETQTILLPGSGFTPNAQVDFTRDGDPVRIEDPIQADPAGAFSANLTLPGLIRGQRRLSYLAIDTANRANIAGIGLLVTATDVTMKPLRGAPSRVLNIAARGFFGGRRLWAHVVRKGGRRARTMLIGRITGACRKARARKRIFSTRTAAGTYRVQFDTFRAYERDRAIKSAFRVTIARGRAGR